jgi:hypothetical protein
LEKADWSNDIDLRCVLNPDFPKANKHLANLIRLLCRDVPEEKTSVIGHFGAYFVGKELVFYDGNRSIWREGLKKTPEVILYPLSDTRLVVDPDCSEQEADAGMMRIMDLSPEAGTIIFAQNLLYVMREAFVDVGVIPRCCIFLHGKTGLKKTTYAVFQSQLNNRDRPLEHPTRLNASIPAAVCLLKQIRNRVKVLDDLFPSQDAEIFRQQEKLLYEILRFIGDGIEPARMKGQNVAKAQPRCGVLFTGEYCIGTGSDAARLLPVKMTIPIDNGKLADCQREPLILSTFYNYFIAWYVTNFDEICSQLKVWLAKYRNAVTEVHARLQETHFCLEAAFKLFLMYREEKKFITSDVLKEQYDVFYQRLRSIVREQNARVNREGINTPTQVDYLSLIRSLLRSSRFTLVYSGCQFIEGLHDGVLENDYLSLRRDKLMAIIHTQCPAADFSDVLKDLKARNALKIGKDATSMQIGGSSGHRFYKIKRGLL